MSRFKFLSSLLCSLALLSSTALAAADLTCFYETDPGGYKLTCQLTGGEGSAFAVYTHVGGDQFDRSDAMVAGVGTLDENGAGSIQFIIPTDALPLRESSWLTFAATYMGEHPVLTSQAELVLGPQQACDQLDFNFTIGDDDAAIMVAGREINEQWASIGMHIGAVNKDATHPDKAILFDTNNPTGGDDDLGVGIGMGLIIAENDFDGNNDDLVDDPDDEAKGGSLSFDFDVAATICGVRLVDIDDVPGTELRFYRNGDLVTPDTTMPIFTMGDGSIQDVVVLEEDVDRFEVFFKGSGMVGSVDLLVCPITVNFDETTLGKPLGFGAGQWITNQFAYLGMTVSAINNGFALGQNHPDKAILFDTANPTGGDDDLMTPNPNNPTNNEPLGLVFILAEDDFDNNNDGLVDDPDDEAGGGEIRFDFDIPVTFRSAQVLDCDANELDVFRFYDGGGVELGAFTVPDMPDGSVQKIDVNLSGVRKAVIELGGSGAVAGIQYCPDPTS